MNSTIIMMTLAKAAFRTALGVVLLPAIFASLCVFSFVAAYADRRKDWIPVNFNPSFNF